MEHLPNLDRQKKVMFNRTITALFLASFFILLLVFFNPIILGLVLTMIAILAFNEWINLMDIANLRKKIVLILFFLAMIALLYFSNYTLTNYINKIYLMFWVFILTIPISLLIGIISGMREGSKTDRTLSVFSIITTSVPPFVMCKS